MKSLLTVPALVGALVLTTPLSAQAATKKVQDGPDGYRLPAYENLTGARYDNGTAGFAARLAVRDLRRKTQSVGLNLRFPAAHTTAYVFVTRFANGKLKNDVEIVDAAGETVRKGSCAELTTTWSNQRDRIFVTVPWSCLNDLRTTVKVDAFFSMGDGTHGDPSDFITRTKVAYD